MRMPVANSTRTLATSPRSEMRSTAPATLLTTGRWNSFGITDHSLASTQRKDHHPEGHVGPLGHRVAPRRPRRREVE